MNLNYMLTREQILEQAFILDKDGHVCWARADGLCGPLVTYSCIESIPTRVGRSSKGKDLAAIYNPRFT